MRGGKPSRQAGQERLLHGGRHRQQRRRVGADRHEGDVAKVQHSGIAHENVEADHGDDVDEAEDHAPLGDHAAILRGKNDQQHHGDQNPQRRATFDGVAHEAWRGRRRPGFERDRHYTRSFKPRAGNRPCGRNSSTNITTTNRTPREKASYPREEKPAAAWRQCRPKTAGDCAFEATETADHGGDEGDDDELQAEARMDEAGLCGE